MKTMTITIPQEDSDRIQALQYECDSRKDLLSFMLSKGTSPSDKNFDLYHKEYQKFHADYEQAKEEMQKEFLEPQVPGKLLNWNLTFLNCEVTCEYEEN